MTRDTSRKIHHTATIWQRAAVGALALGLLGNGATLGLYRGMERRAAVAEESAQLWEKRYTASVAIQQDALEAYGALRRQVAAETAARAAKTKAYEELGTYHYVGHCVLTAYCCESKDNPHICGTGTGLTASGLPVAPGMVAVDPEVIPLGATVMIDGVPYLAADTGVSGLHVDIALATHEDALQFGVQSADVWVVMTE